MNLSRELVKFIKTASPDTTIDDFFEHCKIPQDRRNDFIFAAILKGASKIWDEDEKGFWDKIRRHNNVNSNG